MNFLLISIPIIYKTLKSPTLTFCFYYLHMMFFTLKLLLKVFMPFFRKLVFPSENHWCVNFNNKQIPSFTEYLGLYFDKRLI